MATGSTRKILSSLFLFIFFTKMLISVGPLFALHFDKGSIISVIMQLEIENNENETETVKEKPVKDLCCKSDFTYSFLLPVFHLPKVNLHDYDHEHIQTFYPSVPTPPPNA